MIALALRYWWAIAIAALCMALVLSRMEVSQAHREFSEYRLAQQEARILADKAQRTEEQRRQSAVNKEASNAQERIAKLETDVDAARSAADSLHTAIGAAIRGTRKDSRVASAGQNEPGADTLDLLSRVLYRHSQELVAVGKYAESLAISGSACERISDRLSTTSR